MHQRTRQRESGLAHNGTTRNNDGRGHCAGLGNFQRRSTVTNVDIVADRQLVNHVVALDHDAASR